MRYTKTMVKRRPSHHWMFLLLLSMSLLLSGCEEPIPGLTKSKIHRDTINHSTRFHHYELGDTEHAIFYKPVSPDLLLEKYAILRPGRQIQFSSKDMPFEVEKEEAFLVQYGSKESPSYQVQLNYYGQADDYGHYGDLFYKINMMEVKEDPFQSYIPHHDGDQDDLLNRVDVSTDEAGTTFYHFIQTTDSSYAYSSYVENEMGDVIVLTTAADEIMFYKNGFMVEIGYLTPSRYNDPERVPNETVIAEMLATAQKLAKQL
ncbi:hypothetical protein [Paenibacillus sp. Marseille-Q7038]